MRLSQFALSLTLAAACLAAPAAGSGKKSKKQPAPPKDSIQVVGHLAMTGGPVMGFVTTRHYSSYYLYAEHKDGKLLTLIDVTNAARPSVLADVVYPSGDSNTVVAVAGTAALITEGPVAAAPAVAFGTIRILDLSDPEHPKVAHELAGVTAVSRDSQRDLIFVANADGIWILRQDTALDPAVEKAYSDYVLYSH
jgi:hypothetical protein